VVDSLVLRVEARRLDYPPVLAAATRCCWIRPSAPAPTGGDKPPLLERGAIAPDEDEVRDLDLPFYQRYVPLVLVTRCPAPEKATFQNVPDAQDLALLAEADALRPALPFDPADFAIEPGRKSRQLTPRDIHNYLDLFSSRQLLYLHHAIQLLPQFAMRKSGSTWGCWCLPRWNLTPCCAATRAKTSGAPGRSATPFRTTPTRFPTRRWRTTRSTRARRRARCKSCSRRGYGTAVCGPRSRGSG
jgi:hypothetical protein